MRLLEKIIKTKDKDNKSFIDAYNDEIACLNKKIAKLNKNEDLTYKKSKIIKIWTAWHAAIKKILKHASPVLIREFPILEVQLFNYFFDDLAEELSKIKVSSIYHISGDDNFFGKDFAEFIATLSSKNFSLLLSTLISDDWNQNLKDLYINAPFNKLLDKYEISLFVADDAIRIFRVNSQQGCFWLKIELGFQKENRNVQNDNTIPTPIVCIQRPGSFLTKNQVKIANLILLQDEQKELPHTPSKSSPSEHENRPDTAVIESFIDFKLTDLDKNTTIFIAKKIGEINGLQGEALAYQYNELKAQYELLADSAGLINTVKKFIETRARLEKEVILPAYIIKTLDLLIQNVCGMSVDERTTPKAYDDNLTNIKELQDNLKVLDGICASLAELKVKIPDVSNFFDLEITIRYAENYDALCNIEQKLKDKLTVLSHQETAWGLLDKIKKNWKEDSPEFTSFYQAKNEIINAGKNLPELINELTRISTNISEANKEYEALLEACKSDLQALSDKALAPQFNAITANIKHLKVENFNKENVIEPLTKLKQQTECYRILEQIEEHKLNQDSQMRAFITAEKRNMPSCDALENKKQELKKILENLNNFMPKMNSIIKQFKDRISFFSIGMGEKAQKIECAINALPVTERSIDSLNKSSEAHQKLWEALASHRHIFKQPLYKNENGTINEALASKAYTNFKTATVSMHQ